MDVWTFFAACGAAVIAGAVNAIAGGGTLLTFPVLTALGVPPVAANVTNTVALCPGYVGGTLAQWGDLAGQRSRLWLFLPVGVLSGLLGGLLLLHTEEKLFRDLVPYLILSGSALLAIQEPLRSWIVRRLARQGEHHSGRAGWALVPVAFAGVYGGYFGAGLSVIVLAVLGLVLDDSLTRLNALKQVFGFAVNSAAAVFFLFSSQVVWPLAVVMAVGALAGGALGGRLAGRIHPAILRRTVVVIGVVVALIYFFK